MRRAALILLTALSGQLVQSVDASEALVREQRLVGHWQPDPEQGDDPDKMLRQAQRSAERTLDDLAGPSIRNRPSRRATGAAAARLMQPLVMPTRHLQVEAEGVRMRFIYDADTERVVHTDGRASTVDADRHSVVFAAWEADTLYIERSSLQGTRVIEAWRREGPALRVDYEVLNGLLEDPLEFSLYLVPAPQAATDAP